MAAIPNNKLEYSEMIITLSRDHVVMIWVILKITPSFMPYSLFTCVTILTSLSPPPLFVKSLINVSKYEKSQKNCRHTPHHSKTIFRNHSDGRLQNTVKKWKYSLVVSGKSLYIGKGMVPIVQLLTNCCIFC